MNSQKYAKTAKICAVTGALLISATASYAETIVHTTRTINNSENVGKDKVNFKAKSNTKGKSNKEITPRQSIPYSWEEAVEYAKMHPEDIKVHKYGGYKDKYGNFSRMRTLDFLGDEGLANRGNGILGFPDFTYLRLTLNYGQATISTQPYAIISWNFNKIAGISSANPILNIVFESGYVKQLSTSTEWYSGIYKHSGILVYTWATDRGGSIWLTNEDIWDIYQHGNIANVYISSSGYRNIHFFYSGEKQEEHKKQLTYGFEHIVRLLNITPATIAYEREQREAAQRKAYFGKLRSGAKEEIYKDEMKKEILEEVRKGFQEDMRKLKEGK